MKLAFTLCAALLAFQPVAHAQAPARPVGPPPIEAFFDEGSIRDMELSPNGRWRGSIVVPEGGGPLRLVVSDLTGKEPPLAVAAFSSRNVRRFMWVNDDLLLAWVTDDRNMSSERKTAMLVSASRDGKSMRQLIKADYDTDFQAPGAAPLEANHWFLSLGKPGTDEIIVAAGRWDPGQERWYESPMVLNARTGARRSLLKDEPKDVIDWLLDTRGEARGALSLRENQAVLRWRDDSTNAWRELMRFEPLNPPFAPSFVDGDGQLYVAVNTPDGRGEALHKFDFATGRPAPEPLISTPGYDGGFLPIFDRVSGRLTGVQLALDASETVWLDSRIAALQKQIDGRIKGRINKLICERCDSPTLLVFSYSDRAPGDYLLWQPASGQLERLGARRPAIDPAAMSPMVFERTKARDGADLPVWVTLPGGGAAKNKPAVVLVHGGPNSRGRSWRWDADSQFLASRGYVVIEPEFRGSTGYGDAHFRAGFKQWGRAMQDDVADAVAWAVGKGWVDPARVCIAGASYGGYAVYMGLTRPQDKYRCGVSWIGVADLNLMLTNHWDDVSRNTKKYSDAELVGDPVKDAAYLAAVDPVKLADRIKAPLLAAYGGIDRRVVIDHSDRMRDALKKAGQNPEWVIYANEGHGWRQLETNKDFWKRVEAFLARHLTP